MFVVCKLKLKSFKRSKTIIFQMVILVKNVFISLLSSFLQTCVQTLLETWWNRCAESLVPHFWNYLWNIVTVFKDVCK